MNVATGPGTQGRCVLPLSPSLALLFPLQELGQPWVQQGGEGALGTEEILGMSDHTPTASRALSSHRTRLGHCVIGAAGKEVSTLNAILEGLGAGLSKS
jgi:hypothetical protein